MFLGWAPLAKAYADAVTGGDQATIDAAKASKEAYENDTIFLYLN